MHLKDAARIVNQHNNARRILQLPLIEWDLSLAAGAQAWADQCQFKHSPSKQRTRDYARRAKIPYSGLHESTVGENIVAEPVSKTGKGDAIQADAIFRSSRMWDCDRNVCEDRSCGTFLQAVNEETTRIGCGFKVCEENSPYGAKAAKWNFLVCFYNPMLRSKARPFHQSKCYLHRGM